MHPLIDDIVREGTALAGEMERGQANRPLLTWFEETRRELQAQPLIVTLIAASESVRQMVLGTLVEDAFRNVTIRKTAYPGLLEILLSGSGYALEVEGQRRVEFDALPALLEALQGVSESERAPDGEDVSIWRVSLLSPPERQGLQILVPESVEAIARNPALESVVVSRSHLLSVAVGENAGFGGGEYAVLQRLAGAIGYVLPIAAADAPGPGQTLARELGVARLGTVLPAQLVSALPAILANNSPVNALRRQLQQSAAAKRLSLAYEAVQARFDADQRQLQGRRQRDEALTRADPVADQRSRRGADTVRQRSGDDFAALLRIADETSRRALLPDSLIGRRLRELSDAAAIEDLRQEPEHQQIALTLDERFLHRFQQGLRKAIKEHFQQDMAAIRESLASLKQRTEREMDDGGQPAVIAWLDISGDDLWRRIGELMSFEVRYRGQMPRRGFLQRLGEGRRIVFGVLMVTSLLGTFAGVNLRQYGLVGVLLLFVFIGVVWYSYRNWSTQDIGRMQAELQKVRDQLMQEGRRVVSEVLQEKRLRIADYVEQQKRHYLQQLEELNRNRTEQDLASVQEQRERARQRLRQIDMQLKELQALAPRVVRLRQDVGKLQTETEGGIRELLHKGGQLG